LSEVLPFIFLENLYGIVTLERYLIGGVICTL
jgi:hypothetical protein